MTYTEHSRREQVSVQELIRRLKADEPDGGHGKRRVADTRTRGAEGVVGWLVAAFAVVAVLTAFVVVSLVFDGRTDEAPVLPEVSLAPATSMAGR